MPRAKVVKLPSADDVAKKLAKRDRELVKEAEDKKKALILKVAPLLLEWKDGEQEKHISNSIFTIESEQEFIVKELQKEGFKAEGKADGITVLRPVAKKQTGKPAAAPQRRQQTGTRRAARDPAPSTPAAAAT